MKRNNIDDILGLFQKGEQYLLFDISKYRFAIPLLDIKEIISFREVKKVPELPDFIEGLLNLRGEIIPVFNIKNKLDLENNQKYGKYNVCVVLEKSIEHMGIIVDNVSDVVNFEQTEIEEKSKGNPYIFGSVNISDGEVNILNIEKLFKLKKID